MCGFAGAVVWDDRFHLNCDVLHAMSARLAHRGPDGAGLLLNHESQAANDRPQVGLVHRRLAIVDLDPRANQPFADKQGRVVVFNGEIYNFRELRAQLSKLNADRPWHTTSDTEVLLSAYAEWGGDCVGRLEGMFALAIWDPMQRSLLLARDRMGQKPLYIVRAEQRDDVNSPARCGAIAFASEVQALFPLNWARRGIDRGALVEYLQWGHTFSSQSIWDGIEQLTPGTIRVALEGRISQPIHYWPQPQDLEPGVDVPMPGDSEGSIQRTRELITGAVRRQLVSDVPIGCFLSGGVDSSMIAAAMKMAVPQGQDILTFSIGFDDPRYDETQYATAIAAHLGTQHRAFCVTPDAASDLPKIAQAFGEPFGDSSALPTYYLARETRQHVKVALSGDGGDELFCGYDRYRAMVLGRRIRTALTPLPWMVLGPALSLLPGGHPKSKWERARRFARSLGLSDARRYSSYLRLFDPGLLHRLFRQAPARWIEFDRVVDAFGLPDWNAQWHRRKLANPLQSAMASDRMLYLPDDLLTKVDRCSMHFALEVRSPFMDHHVVALAASLAPGQLLAGGTKPMLRHAFAGDLPDWVFARKKMGFAVPIGDWFRGPLRQMLHDQLSAADSFAANHFAPWVIERLINEHEQERMDHSQRLYALLMLELWWRELKNTGN